MRPSIDMSDDESIHTDSDHDIACIDPEQPQARTRTEGTPHLNNPEGSKHMSNIYLRIFNCEIDIWSLLSYKEEY